MPDDVLPLSEEALRRKIADLEKDRDADRGEIAALKKRLDDLDSEIIDESEPEEEPELELEPWAE